jgi:O-acetylhomoserine (thiol)-lyase
VAALEGGIAALALASGQAAVTYSVLTIAEAGDNIVASSAPYGGTYNLFAHTLPQYGINTRFADYRDPASFEPLIDARTKAIFVESLGNPQGNVTDIARIAEIAHQIPGWPRHQRRRRHRRQRQIPLGTAQATLQAPERTRRVPTTA